MRILPVSLALLLATGLAGCGPDSDINSPPSPVIASAPGPVSSTPTRTPDKEALYEEAERVLRQVLQLEDDFLVAVDEVEYPAELYDLIAEPHLSTNRALFEEIKAMGMRGMPDTHPIWVIERAPTIHKDDSEVVLRLCQDSRGAPLVDEAGQVVSPGNITKMLYYFKHVDGTLKLFSADSLTEVDGCPSE
ncbi:MAG: hypothetical protein ACOX61_03745 [Brooklawnia sp.]